MFKMKGVVPPMITPFNHEGDLDIGMLETLVDYLENEVDGLFICGSYGSGPLMSINERKKVAEVTHEVVNGTIPVIVHVGTTNTRDSVNLAMHSEKIGCDGCAAVAPFYYHHDMDNVIEFFTQLIKSVSNTYPVYIYQNPKFSGYEVSLNTLQKLKELGIHGIKDSTFNILSFSTYMRKLQDENFDVVLGSEALWLAARALGCEAFIPGLGNAFPELCQQMYQEGISNKIEECKKTQFKVNRLREIMYFARSTQLAVYAMLEIRGIVTAYPRSPFVPAGKEEKKDIQNALEELGVL
jgi:dihydrodipicolinate synthase/N-acetylneuraminate lyase